MVCDQQLASFSVDGFAGFGDHPGINDGDRQLTITGRPVEMARLQFGRRARE
jgi:hypothetical protein